jgi:protein TonB
MFESYLFESSNGKGNRFWTTAAGALVMSVFVAVLIVVPLVYHQDISRSVREVLIAPPFPRPAGTPPQVMTGDAIRAIAVQFNRDVIFEPRSVPRTIVAVSDEPLPPDGFVDFIGVPDGVIYSVPQFDALPDIAEPPAAPEQPAQPEVSDSPERTRIWIGGNVQAARLISQPRTPYPPLARQMRVQGTVRLEALINMDGTVEDVRVLSGPPLLVQAALDSVLQWRYQPTLLNGKPVEVMTIIELNFTLGSP